MDAGIGQKNNQNEEACSNQRIRGNGEGDLEWGAGGGRHLRQASSTHCEAVACLPSVTPAHASAPSHMPKRLNHAEAAITFDKNLGATGICSSPAILATRVLYVALVRVISQSDRRH